MTIDQAMAALEEAVIRSRHEKVRTEEVRAALRALLPHCRERWPLTQFWKAAGLDWGHEFAREVNLDASLNGIARQLGRKRA